MNEYNHYIRTNKAGIVVYGFSDAFENPQDSDILIAIHESRHFHEVVSVRLMNDSGQYLLKWDGKQIVERTAQELDEEWSQRLLEPLTVEQQLQIIQLALDDLILGGDH